MTERPTGGTSAFVVRHGLRFTATYPIALRGAAVICYQRPDRRDAWRLGVWSWRIPIPARLGRRWLPWV